MAAAMGGRSLFSRAVAGIRGSLTAALVLLLAVGASEAEVYPAKPIRVIVGFAPGGPADVMARLVAQRMPAILGQSFVVENRPGAGGSIAAKTAAESEPDGYTMLMGGSSQATSRALYHALSFDPIADFAPANKPLPEFPAIERDLNFILDDAVTWQELEGVARSAAGPLLESIAFESQYRGQGEGRNQLGQGSIDGMTQLSERPPDRQEKDALVLQGVGQRGGAVATDQVRALTKRLALAKLAKVLHDQGADDLPGALVVISLAFAMALVAGRQGQDSDESRFRLVHVFLQDSFNLRGQLP